MQVITCHAGQLHTLTRGELSSSAPERTFRTGLAELDGLAPGGALARGAIHELLTDPRHGQAKFFATVLARSAVLPLGECAAVLPPLPPGEGWGEGAFERREASTRREALDLRMPPHRALSQRERESSGTLSRGDISKALVWSDPHHRLYAPALLALGIDLDRLFVLRPATDADEIWAIAECLACRGVGAVVAAPSRLSRVQARRLQLAAERGRSVGILLRHTGRGSNVYAAATRWLVRPVPGERSVQRWQVQLVHGHGGRVNEAVFLEHHRDIAGTHRLRATAQLADRQVAAGQSTRTA